MCVLKDNLSIIKDGLTYPAMNISELKKMDNEDLNGYSRSYLAALSDNRFYEFLAAHIDFQIIMRRILEDEPTAEDLIALRRLGTSKLVGYAAYKEDEFINDEFTEDFVDMEDH